MSGTPDPDLVALQERWSPAWKITRARLDTDPPGQRSGSYIAARIDDSAGIYPTLKARTRKAMDAALEAQLHAAETGALTAPEPPLFP